MRLLFYLLSAVVLVAMGLGVFRLFDYSADGRTKAALEARQPFKPKHFSADMVAGLPEPAQRFFRFAIAEGTPLWTVVDIKMEGEFSLGTQDDPRYRAMFAQQRLGYPSGFLWQVVIRSDEMWISGSDGYLDGTSWSRFWLLGLIPVARVGGDGDHALSAFGRFAAEAVFWTPAAVLPGNGISWRALGSDTAQVILEQDGLRQAVDVTVDERGRPIKVAFDRWTDANAQKIWRLQRFGGYLSEFRKFGGFTLPARIEAGNQFETDAYFPFMKADVTDITFPESILRSID